jgi:hypothetical protein
LGFDDQIVNLYDLSGEFDATLLKCTLPIRHVDISKDGQMIAVAAEYEIAFVLTR